MNNVDKFRLFMVKSRIENNLSKSQLARLIGKSPSFICDIECGRKNPSFNTSISIAKVLDISIDKIFYL